MPGAQIENANLPAEVTGLRLPAWCAAAAAGRGAGQAPRASPAPSAGCVTVLARERRNHLPGALEDPLMQLAFDDRPQDRFLALGVPLVGHLAGPHPGGRAPQMRVSVAAPEHGDHLDRLNASAVAGGGVPLPGPGQLPVCVNSAVAILARMLVDRAAAAQERRVRLLQDPPYHRIKQAHGTAEHLHALRPLAGTLIGPGAKIVQMAEDVRRPGRQILGHASIMTPAA